MERCSKTSFWSKSDGVLIQNNQFHIFQHMSYVPKPQFWSRIGSPWLGLGSNLARMNPTASRNLFKPFPALREPIFGPNNKKTNINNSLTTIGSCRDLHYIVGSFVCTFSFVENRCWRHIANTKRLSRVVVFFVCFRCCFAG